MQRTFIVLSKYHCRKHHHNSYIRLVCQCYLIVYNVCSWSLLFVLQGYFSHQICPLLQCIGFMSNYYLTVSDYVPGRFCLYFNIIFLIKYALRFNLSVLCLIICLLQINIHDKVGFSNLLCHSIETRHILRRVNITEW